VRRSRADWARVCRKRIRERHAGECAVPANRDTSACGGSAGEGAVAGIPVGGELAFDRVDQFEV
jgi:hypothetical protein